MANKQWDEFLGAHDFWEATYWFKSNAMVDGSLFHEFEVGHARFQSEALVMSNRNTLHPDDLSPVKTWGVSAMGSYDWTPRLTPYARYEFFDWTDGYNPDDAWHLFTGGLRWRVHPESKAPWYATLQFSRNLEEGFENLISNDVLYAQLQAEF
jgi:hypothetical protein